MAIRVQILFSNLHISSYFHLIGFDSIWGAPIPPHHTPRTTRACAPPKSFRRRPDRAPTVNPNQDRYRGQAIDLGGTGWEIWLYRLWL